MKYNEKIEIDIQKPEHKSKDAEEYWEEVILKFAGNQMAVHHYTAQMQDELFAMIAGIPPSGTVGARSVKSPSGTVGARSVKSPSGTVGVRSVKSLSGTAGGRI